MKVALVGTPKSKFNDRQWNQSGHDSLMRIKKELGFDVALTEAHLGLDTLTVGAVLRDYAEKGFDLVWAHGIQYQPKTLQVAAEYPRTHFAISMPSSQLPPNVCEFAQGRHEPYYLCGMIAGGLTKTNKVGLISGEPHGGSMFPAMAATIKGLETTNPNAKTKVDYSMDWEDMKMAKKATQRLIDWGADAIVQDGDGTSFGIYEVCRENGVYVNGQWFDQYEHAPKVMYTSIITKWDPAIREAVKDIAKGQLKERYWLKLGNGGYELAPYHGVERVLPSKVKKKVAQAKTDIVSGKLYIRGP